MTPPLPPKPVPRADRVSLWGHLRAFRRDILSAQPARLYRAWMAEFRTPFFESYLCNDPALVRRVLDERPQDFPKSNRVTEGLRPLLGRSVFVTNGEEWLRQRRIIDPAFEGGRLREAFPAIWAASEAAVARMATGEVEVELAASHAAADVIFRTLFSIPIEDRVAQAVFHEFRAYQRSAPILNLGAFLRLPHWVPRLHRGATRRSAREIRGLIAGLTAERAAAIAAGTAPADLATKIMTTPDPVTGARFGTDEMVDQVAIFFLAGHETSASALAWSLYLLATHPEVQERVTAEAESLRPEFGTLGALRLTRDVFREALRLYPPVPMLVRETLRPEEFRGRRVRRGAQVVISPWHLHRHERLWERPDAFDPDRWAGEVPQGGYLPFSRGPRVCPGAGFAMLEGTLMLAHLVRAFRFEALPDRVPVPVAHLTVRARDGIWLRALRR
ncbi:MAG: cytochrome P450 [Tabrizicola flagellatus]|uniref:cytochrome P450 n=1 Tax=Tabrizicola flagellatus TaxID=2593021 RepID=UPI00391CB686